jgi:hypothetical protein
MPAVLTTRYALERSLAQKGHSTLLYEAPRHGWFKFTAWSASTMCLASGYYLVAVWNVGLKGAPLWMSYAYGASGFTMACMGMYWLLRASGIVNSVRALPAKAEPVPPTASAAAGVPQVVPSLDIEVTIKSLFPFVQPRSIVARLDEISVLTRLTDPTAQMTDLEKLEARRRAKQDAEERRRYELAHLYSAPFRHAGRGLRSFWYGTKRFLEGGGFGTLTVKGQRFKLDVVDGWHLDDGRVLEKLVGVKEESKAERWQSRLFRK